MRKDKQENPLRFASPCPVDGKLRYFSRKDAKLAASRIPTHNKLRVYPCGDFWHHTSQPASVRAYFSAKDNPGQRQREEPFPTTPGTFLA